MNSNREDFAIFILSVARWDQDLSSASLSMAKELSKNTRVFYIDHPFTVKDLIKEYRQPQTKQRLGALLFGKGVYSEIEPGNTNLNAITPRLMLPINWLPPGRLYNLLSKINNLIFFRTIRKTIKDFKIKEFIYWNSYNPFFSYRLPANIKPSLFIYQSRDNISESKYVKKHGPELERRAAAFADLRIATSLDLTQRLSIPGKEFIFFPNAANTEIFKEASEDLPVPEDIKHLKGRIIGYAGNICLRQDYDLIYKISQAFPDDTLMFVGPRNDRQYHSYELEKISNIFFVGPKKLKELPGYIAQMDVTIIPFLLNNLTKSIYPLKLNEYLAAGKPVVATNFSADVAAFEKVVYISKDHDEFINNIKKALEENSPERKSERIQIAEKNSWQSRAQEFWNLVDLKSPLRDSN